MPACRARASVSGATIAPAASSVPSIPSVSPATAQMPGVACNATAKPSRNSVLRPPRPAATGADRHRRLPAREQHGGSGQGDGVRAHRAGDARHHRAGLARLALQRVAQNQGREAQVVRHLGGAGSAIIGAAIRRKVACGRLPGLGVSAAPAARCAATDGGGVIR